MIQTTDQIQAVIEQDQMETISTMLADLIEDHRANVALRQQALWKRYTLEDAPIYHRKPASYEKVDRRTANDFYGDIVDTKTGYMGNEVTVSLDRNEYKQDGALQEGAFERDREELLAFARGNATEDANSELVRDAAAVGVGYRLLYVREGENQVRIKNLPPWEVIYIYDQSLDEPQLVLRYYTIQDKRVDYEKKLTAVEWYDANGIRYYIDNGNMVFEPDADRGVDGEQPHLFSGIPIIPFPNNREITAEPEKVTDLIDAYDAIISSTTSEIEQLRMAYMYAKGAGLNMDAEFIQQLERTGIFALPEEGEVGFINKQIADAPVQNLLAEIRRNIYQFAKSIDMSKDFGGEMRVIGWQVALLNLENSSKITERKFTKALRKQYELITQYWREYRGVDVDPMTLEFTFTRNFPRDIRAEAETLQLLLNSVSTKTALEQMSFVDDAEAEMERMEEEGSPYRSPVNANARPGDEPGADTEEV
jgi:SPP1 family phage portal protein